jgi:hypothetical protein
MSILKCMDVLSSITRIVTCGIKTHEKLQIQGYPLYVILVEYLR